MNCFLGMVPGLSYLPVITWELVSKNANLEKQYCCVLAVCLAGVVDFNTPTRLEGFSSLSTDAISIFKKEEKERKKEIFFFNT